MKISPYHLPPRILLVGLCLAATIGLQQCQCLRIGKALVQALVTRSGAPPKQELREISARSVQFQQNAPSGQVCIYAVNHLDSTAAVLDTAALLLRQKLQSNGFQKICLIPDPKIFPFHPQPNELAIFWERAYAFRKETAPLHGAYDYLLMLDIFGNLAQKSVVAVHVCALNRSREFAYLGLFNSHHAIFRETDPHDISDALDIFITDFHRESDKPSKP